MLVERFLEGRVETKDRERGHKARERQRRARETSNRKREREMRGNIRERETYIYMYIFERERVDTNREIQGDYKCISFAGSSWLTPR